jgi:hypothetical protein
VLANDDDSNKARQLRIEKDEDGMLKIINRKSGQVLDLCKSNEQEGLKLSSGGNGSRSFPISVLHGLATVTSAD